ncbi:MAG: cytochrome c oxidase subunit II [Gemmatimonadaceae bacterium]
MPFQSRPRRLAQAALTVALVAFLAACGQNHPDSVFHRRTDFNRDVDFLFKMLIYAGSAVFIFVEGVLVYTLFKFRSRPNQPKPEHVHGNTTLEIAWTVIPLIILILIGIPTVKTIFKTEAAARSDALQVEVVGHQWWWEFRYPQYTTVGANGKIDTVVTANELYLPIGKTVNFTLHSRDVIHSFWIPALGGKRDVVSNHTNYLWMTPDSTGTDEFNGACAEYCGTSHANMRFKAFTVPQADFDSWIAHQEQPGVGSPPPLAPPAASPAPGGASAAAPGLVAATPVMPPTPAVNAQVMQAGFIEYPRDKIPAYAMPQTPLPTGLKYDDNLLAAGNVENGRKLVTTGMCIACHTVRGEPMMQAVLGPNLTHLALRTTIAGGIYPNDPRHLARWVKNANEMKAGVIMPTFGLGEYDPVTLKGLVKVGGFTDAQIADIVAYLTSLK